MALEIVAFRVVTPFCGNSIYAWGSVISVILGALSIGYFVGGWSADRWPRMWLLSLSVAVSGCLTIAITFLRIPVRHFVEAHNFDVRIDSLLASMALFFLPTMLMGVVIPFVVRMVSRASAALGRTVGGLYALSTGGSIFGTLFTAFFLINHMNVPGILTVIGFVLIGSAGLFLIGRVEGTVIVTLLALFVGLPCGSASSLAEEKILLERDTMYHHLAVLDAKNVRYLKFDRQLQSGMLLSASRRSALRYTDFLHLAMVFRPESRRLLVVGLGGGSAQKEFYYDYPWVSVETVELDPVVVQVARRYFFLPSDGRFMIHVEDGRRFLARSHDSYDIIVMDAYFAEAIPFHLLTSEFFEIAKKRLSPDGILVSNIIGSVRGHQSRLYRSALKTIQTVFPTTYTFAVPRESEGLNPSAWDRRNLIVIATSESASQSRDEITASARRLSSLGRIKIRRIEDWASCLVEPEDLEDVPVLQDDFAPVDDLMPIP